MLLSVEIVLVVIVYFGVTTVYSANNLRNLRSYDIRIDGEVRRRNRKDIWLTNEQPLEDVAADSTPLPLAQPAVPPGPVNTPSALPSVAESTSTPYLSPYPPVAESAPTPDSLVGRGSGGQQDRENPLNILKTFLCHNQFAHRIDNFDFV